MVTVSAGFGWLVLAALVIIAAVHAWRIRERRRFARRQLERLQRQHKPPPSLAALLVLSWDDDSPAGRRR